MRTYSVAQVEMLTGIRAHTLRIWERRYSIIKPLRTDTNIRYYTDDQLKQLLNINILLRNGYRISKLDKMPDDKIYSLVADIIDNSSETNQDDIDALSLAMIELSESDFNAVFNKHVMKSGLQNTMVDLVYPFLNHVGVLWATNKVNSSQEHFISNLIRQKLISAIEALPMVQGPAPTLLLFLVDGEHHELGLLLAQYIAKGLGYQVHYLGQNVPIEDLTAIVNQIEPKVLVTFFISPISESDKSVISNSLLKLKLPILISGNRNNCPISFDNKHAQFIENPRSLIEYLEKIKP